MKENEKKLKIIKFINFLSVSDNTKNCYTDIWGCCSTADPMNERPLCAITIV